MTMPIDDTDFHPPEPKYLSNIDERMVPDEPKAIAVCGACGFDIAANSIGGGILPGQICGLCESTYEALDKIDTLTARVEELEHPKHRDVTIPVLHEENRRLIARIQSLLCQRHSAYTQFEDEEGEPFCLACSCEDQEAGWQKAEVEIGRLEDMLKESGRVNLKLQADKKRLREALSDQRAYWKDCIYGWRKDGNEVAIKYAEGCVDQIDKALAAKGPS